MSAANTVIDLFRARAKERPQSIALVDAETNVSYRQLDADSDAIAAHLSARSIGPGDLVPLLSDRSASLVTGLLGIAKSGAAYVPIDEAYPEARKQYIMAQTKSRLALASPGAWTKDRPEVLDIAGLAATSPPEAACVASPRNADAAYAIFTSGTTGLPKGVVIEHAALENLIAWHNREFQVCADSRLTLMAKTGFDVSQWEIWSALCAGARLYLLDQAVRLDADALAGFYTRNSITHAFVPTVMIPDVVAATRGVRTGLRYLFTAGEKLNPVDLDGIDYPLVDYYGPTEATIFATARRVPSASAGVPYSIGAPVAGAAVYLLDDALRAVAQGEIGELCIGGPGLARGYLDNEALTRERFVFKDGRRLYRTGDLARMLPDGNVQFLGRGDDQVKIRGNRVELGEIEAQLQALPTVRNAAVAATAPDNASDKEIVAFLMAEPGAAATEQPDFRDLRARLAAILPDYMVPAAFVAVDAFPLTPNGKIDKAALLRGYAERGPSRPDRPQVAYPSQQAEIAAIFARTLGHGDFGPDDSFFSLGGQSLLAAKLIKDIALALDVKTYIRDIYEFPTVRALSSELTSRSGQSIPAVDAEPIRALQADIRLIERTAPARPYDTAQIAAPRHILLTGATGFVGAHLLCDLLDTTAAIIHCPIRAASDDAAAVRLKDSLRKYALDLEDRDLLRIRVYAADLAESRLGLSALDYRRLAGIVDAIYHSASAVNFIQPYSYMRRDNVQGLREIVAFCTADRIKPLILLSTISVYSWGHLHTGKRVMREEDDIDQNIAAVITDIGYVRSKWVMEKIADLAQAQGLPLMTFRLGYATFNSRTGRCADYQWWSRLVRTCIAHGTVPDLRDLREGLTTVDYMTSAIAHISRKPEALGKKFNLIHRNENNLTLLQFFARLETLLGSPFRRLPFSAWLAQWENDQDAPLYPLLSLFKDVMHEGQSTVELYQRTYQWDCSNVQAFLQGSGIREPTFSDEQLQRYLEQSIVESPRVSGQI